MASWMDTLGITEKKQVIEAQEKLADQAVRQVTKESDNSRITYTARDHDTLGFILEHPVVDHEGYFEVSNSKLAFLLGMSAGAAAARVSRLVKMGVLKPWYEVAVETGKVNRRILQILEIPPAPWSPK